MQNHRRFSMSDYLCLNIDHAIRAIWDNPKTTGRHPKKSAMDNSLSESQRKHSAALMRINHTGEVCAQALYHGQAIASRDVAIKDSMQKAALEEGDHLMWCYMRLLELNNHTSYLNPIWYTGSIILGLLAGLMGDQWSLGFLAETEKQVVDHLEKHLMLLGNQDPRSSDILQQMQRDEAKHREAAIEAGAAVLPPFIKKSMQLASKVMVKVAYWI